LPHLDAANIQDPADFLLREIVNRFVRSDTIFVQSTELAVPVINNNLVSERR
jgi:hypothetical protein